MKVKFTQFFDVSSSASQFNVFTVTAGGQMIKQRCAPQFAAYKYYKLGRVTVKLVPASTLPVDPTGLSYEAGENTVDPRDMFNPGLVRITNGEDISSFAQWDMNTYYATLLDPRWYKFRLQQGFSRSAIPLAYNIGQIHQSTAPGDALLSKLENGATKQNLVSVGTEIASSSTTEAKNYVIRPANTADYDRVVDYALLQTGRIKLGWMPTDVKQDPYSNISPVVAGSARVPEVDLITFILPRAYKTLFYYRVFVTTEVLFKDPVVINPLLDTYDHPYVPVDRFVGMQMLSVGDNTRVVGATWKTGGFDS